MNMKEWIYCPTCNDYVPRKSTHGEALLQADIRRLIDIHKGIKGTQ